MTERGRGLHQQLAELPALAPGHRRVFRGQTAVYGSMRPTGLRSPVPHPDDKIFRVYSHLLAETLDGTEETALARLDSWAIWVRAIAQHYGPGSRFLDVTSLPEVALWFALHQGQRSELKAAFGPDGPLDAATDAFGDFELVRFSPTLTGDGFVFVFDVPEWSGHGIPAHGELVDLASSPPFFASSPRIQAQAACLVAGDRDINYGDLSEFVLGEPIAVSAMNEESPCISWPSETVFPGPETDSWYSRFLAVPLTHRVRCDPGRLELSQAIPATLYQTTEAATLSTVHRLIVLEPQVLWTHIHAEVTQGAHWLPEGFAPQGATPIMLELPLFAMTPPIDSALWNYLMATANVPSTARTTAARREGSTEIALSKAFVEFSPLEIAVWDGIESADRSTTFARGAYLDRSGDDYVLWLVDQTFPASTLTVHGPYRFGVRGESGEQELRLLTADGTHPLNAAPGPGKTLLLILMVLKELGPQSTPSPAAASIVNGQTTITPALGGGTLHEVAAGRDCEPVYLLRASQGNSSTVGLLLDGRSRSIIVQAGNSWASAQPHDLVSLNPEH